MDKIKTMIIHNNIKTIENIEENIKSLDNVEIVGTVTDSKEAINKIIELKPDIVFTKYKFKDITGTDLMLRASEYLKDETPTFKFISSNIVEEPEIKNYKWNDKNENKKKVKSHAMVKELGIDGVVAELKNYKK